ncbi:MAG: hypothetical protein ABFC24_04405 [Methanoregulaceae archaeon]
MPVDIDAEKEANAELLKIKTEWSKITNQIKDFQISKKEEKAYFDRLWQEKDGFKYRYGNFISIEFYRDALGDFESIRNDLELSLRRGRENYERERHNSLISWGRVLGISGIVLVIVIVFCKLAFNIDILFFK